jgi:L-malate glycosyltransferase
VNRRIRITYFIHSFEQGGAERQLAELIKGLDRSRFEPSLIVCVQRDQLGETLNVTQTRVLHDSLFPTPWGVYRLAQALRELQPDVVHTVKGLENAVGRVVARSVGIQHVVASVRTPGLTTMQRLGERFTHRYSDVTVVNSVGIRSELLSLGFEAREIAVVENGVDLQRFVALTDSQRREQRALWQGDRGPLWVMPGRISPEKNQLHVVRALAMLDARGVLPTGLRVVFAGRDSLWVYGRRVQLEARARGVWSRCSFVGHVAAVAGLMAASDLVLLPSHFEGLPNAVIEAMACGVAVMVTPGANADGLVTDGIEGVLARSSSAADIAEALERCIALSDVELSEMGHHGKAHAVKRFTREAMVTHTEAVYDRLIR